MCRRVTDHQIRHAAVQGAVSLECLQFQLGVATQCGRCADCASSVLCDARAALSKPAPTSHPHPISGGFAPQGA
ncbi:MAG TPA: (2Fe-2S)-binding protein [Burkholderiaceae bacterium]|nr:(2Fe-2S)-binding protein [Burkholderiaceae bacterium]